jgi:hypothetical protein
LNGRTLIDKNVRQNGGYVAAIRKTGFLPSVDFALFTGLDILLSKLYRPHGTKYGLPEAVLRMRRVDEFERYAIVLDELSKAD